MEGKIGIARKSRCPIWVCFPTVVIGPKRSCRRYWNVGRPMAKARYPSLSIKFVGNLCRQKIGEHLPFSLSFAAIWARKNGDSEGRRSRGFAEFEHHSLSTRFLRSCRSPKNSSIIIRTNDVCASTSRVYLWCRKSTRNLRIRFRRAEFSVCTKEAKYVRSQCRSSEFANKEKTPTRRAARVRFRFLRLFSNVNEKESIVSEHVDDERNFVVSLVEMCSMFEVFPERNAASMLPMDTRRDLFLGWRSSATFSSRTQTRCIVPFFDQRDTIFSFRIDYFKELSLPLFMHSELIFISRGHDVSLRQSFASRTDSFDFSRQRPTAVRSHRFRLAAGELSLRITFPSVEIFSTNWPNQRRSNCAKFRRTRSKTPKVWRCDFDVDDRKSNCERASADQRLSQTSTRRSARLSRSTPRFRLFGPNDFLPGGKTDESEREFRRLVPRIDLCRRGFTEFRRRPVSIQIEFDSASSDATNTIRPTTLDDLGGLKKEKIEPERTSGAIRCRPRGILLYGPKGCGKTMLINALAHELNANVLRIYPAEIYSRHYGESETKLKRIFAQVTKVEKRKTFLVVENIESLCPHQERITQQLERRLTTTFIDMLDRYLDGTNVLLIATTNRIDAIDADLRRPGRLDEEIEIGIPNQNDRFEVRRAGSTNEEKRVFLHRFYKFICERCRTIWTTNSWKWSRRKLTDSADRIWKICAEKVRRKSLKITKVLSVFSQSVRKKKRHDGEFRQRFGRCSTEYDAGSDSRSAESEMGRRWRSTRVEETFGRNGRLADEIRRCFGSFECSSAQRHSHVWTSGLFENDGGESHCHGVRTELHRREGSREGVEFPRRIFPRFVGTRTVQQMGGRIGTSDSRVVSSSASRCSCDHLLRWNRCHRQCSIQRVEFVRFSPRRGSKVTSALLRQSNVSDRVIATLLIEMDGIEKLKGVTIIAATNRPDCIDPVRIKSGHKTHRFLLIR